MPPHPLRKPLPPNVPQNSLGLSMRDLDALLDRIDDLEKPLGSKRTHTRRPFRRSALTLHVEQPGGRSTVAVAGRNLSPWGLCVLHRAYLHVGTLCTVDLPLVAGGEAPVSGKVIRCIHREGVIHDLGIRFNHRISINDHDRLDHFSRWLPTLERVDPTELRGSLLLVEDSAADARLVRHILSETGVSVTVVGSREAALQRAPQGFDVIVSDHNLGDGDAGQIIAELSARNIATPVIVATAETNPAIRAKICRVPAAAFVAKPYDGSFLVRLLAEFLGPERAQSGVGVGSLAGASVAAVLDDLLGDALKIQSAIATGNAENVRRLCVSMRSTAQALNMAPVLSAAEFAVKSLTASMSVDESAAALSSLVHACIQAAGRRSAA